MANRLVSVDENFRLPPEVLEQATDDVRIEFSQSLTDAQAAATNAGTAAATASAAAITASTARDQAVAAAESITVPTDDLVDARIEYAIEQGEVDARINSVVRTSGGPMPGENNGRLSSGRARVTMETINTHAAFPGLAALPTGELVATWRRAAGHTPSTPGTIVMTRSLDNGATWTAENVIVTDTLDLRDPSFSYFNDRLWLTYFKHPGGSTTLGGCWVRYSEDGGVTWSSEVRIENFAYSAIAAPLAQMANGNIVAVWYGRSTGETTYDSTWVSVSSDNGATWGTPTRIANGTVDGRSYNEPWLVVSGGTLVCMMRYGDVGTIGRSASVDNGASWSAVVSVIDGSGRPSSVLTGGVLVCIYRKNSTAEMRSSNDLGLTWGPPTVLDTAGTIMVYAAPVEVASGVLAVPYALENGGSSSRMYFNYVLVGGGRSPLGYTAQDRANANIHGTPVIWDDFYRPDSSSISPSPQGLTWSSTGAALALVDGYATATATGVGVSQLDSKLADVDVRCKFRWWNVQGLGLIARHNGTNTYLYAAVEGSGNSVRLYKVVNGTATALGSAGTTITRHGKWHSMRFLVTSATAKIYIDEAQVVAFSFDADADSAALLSGTRQGFRYNSTAANYHNFKNFAVLDF